MKNKKKNIKKENKKKKNKPTKKVLENLLRENPIKSSREYNFEKSELNLFKLLKG